MKVLTLWQPHAALVAIGAKKVETRSWPTAYRGELAIHAGRKFPREYKELCLIGPFRTALRDAGYHTIADLPLGAIVAVVDLVLVGEMYRDPDGDIRVEGHSRFISNDEIVFGHYAEGRFGWLLENPRRLPEPVLCSGARQLWEADPRIEERVREQLR